MPTCWTYPLSDIPIPWPYPPPVHTAQTDPPLDILTNCTYPPGYTHPCNSHCKYPPLGYTHACTYPLNIPNPWTYLPLDIPTPQGDMVPEIPCPRKDMGPEIPTSLWKERLTDTCSTCILVHFYCPTLIPIPIIVPILIVCRSAPLGPIPMVFPMQIMDTSLVYSKNWLLLPLIHYWPV